MSYQFPDTLAALRSALLGLGMDVTAFKTERQAAFMIQQLLGTKFKFPPKGQSCFPLLQRLEATAKSADPAEFRRGRDSHPPTSRNQSPAPSHQPSQSTPAAGLVIYCDGACEPNPGAGGWGFVVYRDGVEIHSEHGGANPTTNQRMELTAALMALRWFAGRGIVEPVRLLSDSMYTVEGCNSWRHSWKARGWRRKGKNPEIVSLDLWRDLDEALTLLPITLEWVKGHVGTLGNERADELAAIGRETVLAPVTNIIEEQLRYAAI